MKKPTTKPSADEVLISYRGKPLATGRLRSGARPMVPVLKRGSPVNLNELFEDGTMTILYEKPKGIPSCKKLLKLTGDR